jgi:hypothetical protein
MLRICRLGNTALDTLFYDVGALTATFLSGSPQAAQAIARSNLFGTLGLVAAVALGITSAQGSPLQLIHAGVGSEAIPRQYSIFHTAWCRLCRCRFIRSRTPSRPPSFGRAPSVSATQTSNPDSAVTRIA